MHSACSDGRLPPDELVTACARAGLDVIALTEHDLPPPVPGGHRLVAGRSLLLLEAVELSAAYAGQELHVLVFFPGPMPSDWRAFLTGRARQRAVRYDEARARIGLPGVEPADEAAHHGERSITRLHLARAIVAAGHAPHVGAAMEQWTGQRRGLVPLIDLPMDAALRDARDAGGVCVWAHPTVDQARRHAAALRDLGMAGMEVHRPSVGRYDRNLLGRIAWRLGMVVSGGSDFHGWSGGAPGAFTFPAREARPLLHLLDIAA